MKKSSLLETACLGCAVFVGAAFVLIFAVSFISDSAPSADRGTGVAEVAENDYPSDTEAGVVARGFVERHLNYPSDSEFPGMFDGVGSVIQTENEYIISHWVDAANGFGAKKRTYYSIKIRHNGGNWADPRNWEELEFSFD